MFIENNLTVDINKKSVKSLLLSLLITFASDYS